jgi:KaiC/GvpD/RAD55 family RecA-like ATPase
VAEQDRIIKELEITREDLLKAARLYGKKLGAAKRKKKRLIAEAKANAIKPEASVTSEDEAVFSTSASADEVKKETLRVDKEKHFDDVTGMHSSYDETIRRDVKIQITNITYRVETVTDPRTGKSVRASTDGVGPRGLSVTWGTIGNFTKLNAGFAIPIHRIAMMLGHKSFSPSQIWRILEWTAKFLSPIYLHLPSEMAEADIFSGDDTVTKVLDLSDPFQGNSEKATLAQSVDEALRWKSGRADGKGEKKALNVTLIRARTEADPRSTIRFFRTHIGSFGNLLTQILELRSPKNKTIIIQTDLSNTNLPEKFMRDLFDFHYAGCGAHARRPIWRYRKDDENFCYYLLRAFLHRATIEQVIDITGRTRANIMKHRRYSRWIWQAIKNRCLATMTGERTTRTTDSRHEIQQWPPSHRLYVAAQYIVDNFEALTYYLNEPRLPWTTNKEERGLRFEKCLLSAAKFKGNRNGRVILDILRTFNATCTAAKVEITDYLKWIYPHQADLENNPHLYTPYQYAKHLDSLKAQKEANPVHSVSQSSVMQAVSTS